MACPRSGGTPRAASAARPSDTSRFAVVELRTPRLRLRQWVDADLEPFAALNADGEVMRYLQGPLGRKESDAYAAVRRAAIAEHGHGMWAVEVVDGAAFAGMVGLAEPDFEARFAPAVTVGWRFAREHWGAATPARPPGRRSRSGSSRSASRRSSPGRPSTTRPRVG